MKILIYGVGEIGSLFRNFFFSRGYFVKGYDIAEDRKDVDDISDFDVIFVCVPMSELRSALEHIKLNAKRSALLVDVASVKKESLPFFKKSGFDFLSIHPLFKSGMALSTIVVVWESGGEEEKKILELLRKEGVRMIKMDAETHDREMAKIQGVTHFLLLSFLDYFSQVEHGTQIFNALKKIAERVASQTWEMSYLIQKNAEKEREEFLQRLQLINEIFKDKEMFRRFISNLKSKDDAELILEIAKVTNELEKLDEMRAAINVIDKLLLKLLERRVEIAKKIAEKKKEIGEAVEIKEIEEEKISELLSSTKLNPTKIKEIFGNIIKITKEEEYSLLGIKKTLAVLGPKGSFSEEIALKLVGSRLPLRYCASVDEIVRLVESGEVDYGIVPIENSINGTVLPVLDALMSHNVEVFGEAKLEVVHCLAAKRKLEFNEIKTIYSHPQAIAQCIGFINNYLPKAEIRYTSSTSDAVRMLDDYSAAIVSYNAANLYKLTILRAGIQDLKDRNVTRFYLIRKETGKRWGKITSLFFAVEDKPGALRDVLNVFANKGFNLRKLESRPAKTVLGDYVFFTEVEAPLSEKDLQELGKVTTFFKIVGVFDEVETLELFK